MIDGHLVLLGTERGQRSPVSLDEVVVNLRRLVGPDHPDVEALSLRCADPALRHTAPFTTPPLLERSWRLMVAASQDTPGLVPLALWQRIQAQVTAALYLVWSADAGVQTSQSTALREALLRGTRDVVPPAQARPESMAALEAFGMTPRQERPRNGHSAAPAPSGVSAAVHAHGKTLGLPPAAVAALLGGFSQHERRH